MVAAMPANPSGTAIHPLPSHVASPATTTIDIATASAALTLCRSLAMTAFCTIVAMFLLNFGHFNDAVWQIRLHFLVFGHFSCRGHRS